MNTAAEKIMCASCGGPIVGIQGRLQFGEQVYHTICAPATDTLAARIAEQDAIIEELGAIIEELVGALTERADSCEANITFSDVEWQTGPCECVDCNQNRALIAKATKASSG